MSEAFSERLTLSLLPLSSPSIYSYKGISSSPNTADEVLLKKRQGLPISDWDNKEMLLFWAENQPVLYCSLALHCCAQAPSPKSLKGASATFALTPLCSQWDFLQSAFRDWVSLGSLYWSQFSSQLSSSGLLIKHALQFSCFVFYYCLIFLPWGTVNCF